MIKRNRPASHSRPLTTVTRDARRAVASGTNAGTGARQPKGRKQPAPDAADYRHTLHYCLKPNQTKATAVAEALVAGLAGNAVVTRELSASPFGDDVELAECLKAIRATGSRVNAGDLSDAEALLMAQASALNAGFVRFTLLAQLNIGHYPEAVERYMRLALKAQSQCRATLETLSAIKNPPTVFARQANIAQGPQQVNNVMSQPSSSEDRARAGNLESMKTELLEAHGERLDSGTAGATGREYSPVATVGTLHRPSNGCGQGSVVPER